MNAADSWFIYTAPLKLFLINSLSEKDTYYIVTEVHTQPHTDQNLAVSDPLPTFDTTCAIIFVMYYNYTLEAYM